VARDGPATVVDVMLTSPKKTTVNPEFYEDLVNHRKEVEQYLGGLLGMY
jgi:hypothetical protein